MNDCNIPEGGGSEVGEKWSDSGYNFNIDPTRFADTIDRGCERKKSVEDDNKVWA